MQGASAGRPHTQSLRGRSRVYFRNPGSPHTGHVTARSSTCPLTPRENAKTGNLLAGAAMPATDCSVALTYILTRHPHVSARACASTNAGSAVRRSQVGRHTKPEGDCHAQALTRSYRKFMRTVRPARASVHGRKQTPCSRQL